MPWSIRGKNDPQCDCKLLPVCKGKGLGDTGELEKGVDRAWGRWKAQLDGSTLVASAI